MSGRIHASFGRTKAAGRAALVGYLTGYDGGRARSQEHLFAACEAGLDVLELGVPFSDPSADGPEVAAAMVRARGAGATTAAIIELAAAVRARFELPIVLFSYANPLVRYGSQRLCRDAVAAGVDGLLVVDLPPEHANELRGPALAAGLDWIGLCAPTSTPERVAAVLACARGFVYAVTLAGVTGTALRVDDPQLARMLGGLRAQSPAPVAAGFGIRTPAAAAVVAGLADGVVVGSALVAASQRGVEPLRAEVRALAAAMTSEKRT